MRLSEESSFCPWLTQPSEGWVTNFLRLKGIYDLYDFLFSKENMKQTIKNGKLHEQCKKLEHTLHDIDADVLPLEIDSSLHNFPDHVATCPFDMLNYIYSEKLLDLYSNLSIALRLLLTLPVSVASGERSFSALKLLKTYVSFEAAKNVLTSIEREVRRSLDMEDIVFAVSANSSFKYFAHNGLKGYSYVCVLLFMLDFKITMQFALCFYGIVVGFLPMFKCYYCYVCSVC
ncbi:hypothetical protein AOLI_G00181540 [Acnodon oligacanthus]